MKPFLIFSAVLTAAFADDSGVPAASITLRSPQGFVLAARALQLDAVVRNAAGASLKGHTLQWQVSDGRLASIDANGVVRGLAPGIVDVSASDADSGVAGHVSLYVYPARIAIAGGSLSLQVGDVTTLSAQVLDADGKAIAGVPIVFSVDEAGVAAVNGSELRATGEGRATLLAAIDMGAGFETFTATAVIDVARRADYKVTRLLLAGASSSNVTMQVPTRVAVAGTYAAAVTSLSNGGQALVLARSGQNARILAAAGLPLEGTDRIVAHFLSVSVNANGDVLAIADVPAEWCEQMLVFFRAASAWKPSVLLDSTSCNVSIQPRSLDGQGGYVYQQGQILWKATSAGNPIRILGPGDQPAGIHKLNNLGAYGESTFGNTIVECYDAAGVPAYVAWDGKTFSKIFAVGDVLAGQTIEWARLPVEINAGDYIARAGGRNWSSLARFKGGSGTTVALSGQNNIGWVEDYYDGSGEIMFFHGNIGGRVVLLRANGGSFEQIAPMGIWRDLGPVWMTAPDTVISWAAPLNKTLAAIRYKGTDAATLFGPGVAVDGAAPLALAQNSLSRSVNGAGVIVRTAGDMILKAGPSGATPILKPGDTLPGNTTVAYINMFTANRLGDFAVSVQRAQGRAGLYAYRAGQMQLLADVDTALGAGGATFQYSYSGDLMAMNSTGQVAAALGASTGQFIYRFTDGPATAQRLVQLNASAPGGGNYNCCPRIAIDDGGRVAFVVGLSTGKTALFLWDNGSVQRLLESGGTDPLGRTIGDLYSIAAGGNRFYVRASIPGVASEVIATDGAVAQVIATDNAGTGAGVQVTNLFGPDLAANSRGELVYPALTPAGAALLVRRSGGKDAIAALGSQRSAEGDWFLSVFPGGTSDAGDIVFSAFSWADGKLRFGIYQATPQ